MQTTDTGMEPRWGVLRALGQRMQDCGIDHDVRTVAAVILATALDLDWLRNPEKVDAWLAEVALELAQSSPIRRESSPARL